MWKITNVQSAPSQELNGDLSRIRVSGVPSCSSSLMLIVFQEEVNHADRVLLPPRPASPAGLPRNCGDDFGDPVDDLQPQQQGHGSFSAVEPPAIADRPRRPE